MLAKMAVLSVVAMLLLCGGTRAASVDASPDVDLSDLVVALLPTNGFQTIDWDYLVDDPRIAWKTDGSETDGRRTVRRGMARITVGGKKAQILRQHWEELTWTITLATFGNPTHGPTMIDIQVGGTDPNTICFGSRFRGCDFDEKLALSSKLLNLKRICAPGGSRNYRHVYAASTPGKKPSLLVYNMSGGSGGSSSWLEIRPLSDQTEVCKDD
jgi:hypothetical protein